MKPILPLLLIGAAAFGLQGATFAEGSLKPGARPAPAGRFAATGASAAASRAPERAAAKALFYTVATDNSGAARLSSFTAGYASELEDLMSLDRASGYAGTSVGSDFYYCDYTSNTMGGITAVNWRCIDVDAKKETFSKAQKTANAVCMDMTYDVTTSTLYGMSAMADAVVTIDPATGEAQFAFETLPFYTISADEAGQLYGILLEADGGAALYSINKTTGNALKIGDTGVKMLSDGGYAYFQTAAFSRADGRLYWLTPSATGTDLYRVDPATGRASNLCTLATLEALCLFDLPEAAAPGSPAPVANLKAESEGMSVTLTFDAPSKTADGATLESLSAIEIYRGNSAEPLHTIAPATPGRSCTWTDSNAANGFNVYRILARNDAGTSLPVYASAFCGVDFPAEPAKLRAEVGEDGYPQLTWEAPTRGLNGATIDPAGLTYNIYRDTSGREVLIASGVSATAYRDADLDLSRQAYSYYYVAAVSAAGEGRKSAPAGAHTGPAYSLPFEEAFIEGEPATAPWTMQSLELGGTWEIGIVSNAPGTGPYIGSGMLIFKGFTGVAPGAEARIVTPMLSFENAVSPELHFHFFHADFGDDMHFADHMIVEVSADGGPFTPLKDADLYQYTSNSRWTEYTFPLADYAGRKNVRIGFHGISAGGMDLVLDNIRVLPVSTAIGSVEAGEADAPVEYFNLQGIRVDNPSGGVFVRRQGKVITKVIIR